MVVAFCLVLGVPAFLFCLVWALGSDVVALGLLSPFLIKMWGLAMAVVVSPSSRVFGDDLAVELFGLAGIG
ncbi:BnaA06g10170D [Brassica napus]|uniref:BnaA06g10170D protein n=1 Tax=Brassica napus TaxID=3708 RepID=A0A078HGQ2_BRANA|nr:BnaA06g10170D [Brassica napus]